MVGTVPTTAETMAAGLAAEDGNVSDVPTTDTDEAASVVGITVQIDEANTSTADLASPETTVSFCDDTSKAVID